MKQCAVLRLGYHPKGLLVLKLLGSLSGKTWNCPPYAEGSERRKKEGGHSRLVVAGLIGKKIYIWGFSWAAARCVALCGSLPNLKSLHRCLNWDQLYIYHPDGLNTTSVSQGYLRGGLREQVECTLLGEGRGWGASYCLDPVHTWTRGHVLPMSPQKSFLIYNACHGYSFSSADTTKGSVPCKFYFLIS